MQNITINRPRLYHTAYCSDALRDDIMLCTSVMLACPCLTNTKLESLRTTPTSAFFQSTQSDQNIRTTSIMVSCPECGAGADLTKDGSYAHCASCMCPRRRVLIEYAMLKPMLTRLEL